MKTSHSKTDHCQAINPANVAAERCVLGAVIEDESLWRKLTDSGLRSQHFYLSDHRRVFGAIDRLKGRSMPVDYISVAEELGNLGGDYVLIASLVHGVVVQENHVLHHAAIIRKKSRLRSLLKIGEWIQKAVTEIAEPDSLTAQIRNMLDGCSEDQISA